MEKKKRRHKKLETAALAAGILFVLFFSFHRHLSGELLTGATPTTATIYNIHTQHRHHAILEQGQQAGGSSLPVRISTDTPPAVADGVLFPDWEVLLLLRPAGDHRPPSPSVGGLHCLFHNGAKSPAIFSGVIPSSHRGTYRCALPPSVRRRLPIHVPRLVSSSFHRHLSGELLTATTPTTATIYNIHTQSRHHAILEQDQQTGTGSSLPIRVSTDTPPAVADGVLFPDWEVLLLLRPAGDHRPPSPSVGGQLHCLFHNGARSPAIFSGVIPSSHRGTYRCALPPSVRRRLPIHVPRLVSSSDGGGGAMDAQQKTGPPRELFRWNFLVYESFATNSDVVVFAKGVNNRQGVARRAEDLRCVFHVPDAAVPAVRTAVTSSSQEVFRCLHPDEQSLALLLNASAEVGKSVRISLEIVGGEPVSGRSTVVPSVADYGPRARPAHDKAPEEEKSLLCACTMVFNVAKFLHEWVVYHSRLGVDGFVFYDNGSEDGLDQAVAGLQRQGYNVTSQLWLWPKTQEAGFSHCAAASRGRCEWMMYLDVDEFAFSPSWRNLPAPSRDMLRSILPAAGRRVGQVSMRCYEFGPSNQTAHPAGGVTQGYTCRRRVEERHKSVVRLDAVDPSLHNVVHHFRLREGYRGVAARGTVVNHYKYQAWPEFKAKFRRRASAYVVDWTREANPGSRDRTPGLGFAAVEPAGWAGRFCEVEDTRLRDVVRRWFGRGSGPGSSTEDYRMKWEEETR